MTSVIQCAVATSL